MTRYRVPADLREVLFSLPERTVKVVESSLGAHLVEILEHKPSRERDFSEVEAELIEVLSNQKRDEGITRYLRLLRHRERHKIEIFHEMLEKPWSL